MLIFEIENIRSINKSGKQKQQGPSFVPPWAVRGVISADTEHCCSKEAGAFIGETEKLEKTRVNQFTRKTDQRNRLMLGQKQLPIWI